VVIKLNELLCIHNYIYRKKGNRLYLECMKCQKETNGWQIKENVVNIDTKRKSKGNSTNSEEEVYQSYRRSNY
jgi:hypothetical protein